MPDLKALVLRRVEEIGVKEAATLFDAAPATVAKWASGKSEPSLRAAQIVLNDLPPLVETEQLTEWKGKDVIILLPVYRTFSADTHFTLFANYAKYGPEKIGMIQEKRTVIHEARNILIHKALKTDANWFIFVDDDMILPCGSSGIFNGRYRANIDEKRASLNAFSRLMSHPADKLIVGSLYFGRHENGKAQCSSGFTSTQENEKLHKGEYKGLKTEEWVGTGLMKIHRSVFEQFDKAIAEGKFPECKHSREDMWVGYFNPIRVGMGEDVSFCRRAKEIGIQTYLDTDLICLHNGETYFGPSNTKY
jgi:hypothetical protein